MDRSIICYIYSYTFFSLLSENLRPTSDKGAIYLNEDVGRHFSHFFETHYVPNAEKEKEYPADKKVRHLYYQRKKLDSFNL